MAKFTAVIMLVLLGVAAVTAIDPNDAARKTRMDAAREMARKHREAHLGGKPMHQPGMQRPASMGRSHSASRPGGSGANPRAERPPAPKLTIDQSREAIKAVLAEVKKPENAAKIEVLKKQVEANPDNAMMAMMQLIPMAENMLGDIMSKYGFNQENGGVMTFLNVLQGSDDEEVQKTAKEVRALVVPASMLPMVESMFGGGNKGGRDL